MDPGVKELLTQLRDREEPMGGNYVSDDAPGVRIDGWWSHEDFSMAVRAAANTLTHNDRH